jgi:hypothetical protein
MKDIPVQIKLGGLSPDEDDGAIQAINVKLYNNQLRSVLAPYFFIDLVCEWPFPQLFKLNDLVFVATQDKIYKLSDNVLELCLSDIPNAGYPWDAAAIGDYYIFMNNKVVVGGDRNGLAIRPDIPVGISICNVGDQLIIGAPWAYGAWNNQAVIWGKVGSTDFTIDRSNVAALRFADCGTVLRLVYQEKKTMTGLKPGFVVFGTEGVTSFLVDDAPIVFSKKNISRTGIRTQLAVTNTPDGAMYIGEDGSINSVADSAVKQIGYGHLFRVAQGEVVLNYDDVYNDLYIGI